MDDLRTVGFCEVMARVEGNRAAVWHALLQHGPCTGTELAARMGWTVLSVRPRLTELRQMWFAQATGERRGGEHVFQANDQRAAADLHAAARAKWLYQQTAVGQVEMQLA